jgi:hypothetical protein
VRTLGVREVDFGVNMMINRQLVADVTLALALVLPTAAFAGSDLPYRQVSSVSASPIVARAAPAERSMNERGVGLLG